MNKKIEILGVQFDNMTQTEALFFMLNKHKKNKNCFVVTANPEIVMHATRDKQYNETIKKADLTVADGIGVVMASKMLKKPLKERVAGFDLTMQLLNKANSQQMSVYFIGAETEVVEEAVNKLKIQFPMLKIAGYHNGFFDVKDEQIIQRVSQTKPDIVLAAMGFPRQEYWIEQYLKRSQKGTIAIGVGGSFDVIAGKVQRAPELFQKLNLEWAYRLIKQPSRIGRMIDLPKFLIAILQKDKKNGE